MYQCFVNDEMSLIIDVLILRPDDVLKN